MNTLFINQTAAKTIAPIFTGVFKAISLIPNPLRILRAYEEMSKFRTVKVRRNGLVIKGSFQFIKLTETSPLLQGKTIDS